MQQHLRISAYALDPTKHALKCTYSMGSTYNSSVEFFQFSLVLFYEFLVFVCIQTIADINGMISPTKCMHQIFLEDEAKPTRDAQKRFNPHMKEVVKAGVLKLLDVGIIYPISDSKWVSPVHVVPKKSGITVVKNEDSELVPTRITTSWRVCIDYRRLNKVTKKDYFPLPFIDQMLERLVGYRYYYFLDGYSGYN